MGAAASSIDQYECGVQAICDLQQVVSSANGVLGSRFMGGGFGGCVTNWPAQVAITQRRLSRLQRNIEGHLVRNFF